MKIRSLPTVLALHSILFLTSLVVLYKSPVQVLSATATNLVISEVQIAGATSSDDFVELYNPTSLDINLEGLRLAKRTSTGTISASIVAFAADEAVPAHSYFLWCNTSLDATLSCDKNTTATVADNNSVAIIDGALDGGTVVDAVTFGSPANPLGEGTFLTAPVASSSVERKAKSTSDATSMGTGGADEFAGNGEDTDNNSADFVDRSISQPQNSQAATETPATPSPTPDVTPSSSPEPSATPSESPSPTPEVSPSATPETTPSPTPVASPAPVATPTPSSTPEVSPSATPEISPSPTPEVSPSPTPEVSPTPTPSVTPSATPDASISPSVSPDASVTPTPTATPTTIPSPSPGRPPFFTGFLFSCRVHYVNIHAGFFTLRLPIFRCTFR